MKLIPIRFKMLQKILEEQGKPFTNEYCPYYNIYGTLKCHALTEESECIGIGICNRVVYSGE